MNGCLGLFAASKCEKSVCPFTWLSKVSHCLFASQSMTHSFSCLVRTQTNKNIARKTQLRGKTNHASKPGGHPILLGTYAASFVVPMCLATFLSRGFLQDV